MKKLREKKEYKLLLSSFRGNSIVWRLLLFLFLFMKDINCHTWKTKLISYLIVSLLSIFLRVLSRVRIYASCNVCVYAYEKESVNKTYERALQKNIPLEREFKKIILYMYISFPTLHMYFILSLFFVFFVSFFPLEKLSQRGRRELAVPV